MIVVRVELHSAVTGKITELARMKIVNAGGTHTNRNYVCATLRGRSKMALDKLDINRQAEVYNHRSLSLHVWVLVAKCLTALGYGVKNG